VNKDLLNFITAYQCSSDFFNQSADAYSNNLHKDSILMGFGLLICIVQIIMQALFTYVVHKKIRGWC
jgi:hypothetical protein